MSGEREIDNSYKDNGDTSRGSQERPEADHPQQGKVANQKHARQDGAQDETVAAGRWQPNFMQEELREICLQQLGIPVRITAVYYGAGRVFVRRENAA